jgi:ABC-type dipeptide/oligopeptide/nickel transport system ATPase subunit
MSDDKKIIFSMVGVSKVTPQGKQIIKNIYLSFFYGAKIGIIGLNGSGKSTVMKIIAGLDKSFQGDVVFSPGYSVGYLPQEPELDPNKTVRDIVLEGAQEIVDGLKFQYKPLVIYLNACGSAGSSAGDPDDIGIQEATKRVCDTSLPFFIAGAGAYFATNTYGESFLDDLLKGKTISNCFRVFSEPQFEIYMTETITSKNALNLKTISISGYQDQNKPKAQYYHTAFVGPENFTIKSINQTSK